MIIEEKIIQYLTTEKYSAYAEKPDVPSGEYVLVAKVSGSRTDYLRSANIDIQVYSDSTYNASVLNEKLIDTMTNWNDENVSQCELIAEMINNDLGNGVYSYQTTWQVYYY